jgi:beta-glucuronidase
LRTHNEKYPYLIRNLFTVLGKVFYEVISNTNTTTDLTALIKILDKDGYQVGESVASEDLKGIVTINNVKPWWPYLMHEAPGYLYTMEVRLVAKRSDDI